MRLLQKSATASEKAPTVAPEPAAPTPLANTESADKGRGKKAAAPAVGTSPAPQSTLVDYTRPANSTDLLLELQRRVIKLEESTSRKLTAAEFAIALDAMTGMSIDQWQSKGVVIERCDCPKVTCKGWQMVPLDHHRMQAKAQHPDGSPVRREELKDLPPVSTVDDSTPNLTSIFKKMFDDKLLTRGKDDSTRIPKDGPISWTHEQQLAFAQGFEWDDLLTHRGKPRRLQRLLIERLREAGYTVMDA